MAWDQDDVLKIKSKKSFGLVLLAIVEEENIFEQLTPLVVLSVEFFLVSFGSS